MTQDPKNPDSEGDEDMVVSDDDEQPKPKVESTTPSTPMDYVSTVEGLKRKRDELLEAQNTEIDDPEATPNKLMRSEGPLPPPPPPPSAPPPASNEAQQSPTTISPKATEEDVYAYATPLSVESEALIKDTSTRQASLNCPPDSAHSLASIEAKTSPDENGEAARALTPPSLRESTTPMIEGSPFDQSTEKEIEQSNRRYAIET